MYIGSRRELLWTLRTRAERAEKSRSCGSLKARATEREQIAREMHDVLAHRITQISMQAGAMAFRTDLDASQLREGLGEIQGKANEALNELRDVLGVLREDDAGDRLRAPATDLRRHRGAGRRRPAPSGMDVELTPTTLARRCRCPRPPVARVYRIIQEGITNARKHAPGRPSASTQRHAEAGITVVRLQPAGLHAPPATPGAGLGLVGLGERAELRGGRLVHGQVGRDVRPRSVDTVGGVTPIRVLIVDDDPLVRSALSLMLGGAVRHRGGRRGRRRRRGRLALVEGCAPTSC